MDTLVSHLLWADDLILLALDPFTLQKQLDALHKFCIEWGVNINVDKTELIKFSPQYEHVKSSTFKIGCHTLKEVDSYCYLGIEIHKSGSFALARTELKKESDASTVLT